MAGMVRRLKLTWSFVSYTPRGLNDFAATALDSRRHSGVPVISAALVMHTVSFRVIFNRCARLGSPA